MRKMFKEEEGAVYVEASFVFPVMFFVIFILIYFGNALYIRSGIDSMVTREAIKGAAMCADPMLSTVKESGVPVTSKNLKVKPYDAFFGHPDAVSTIEEEVNSKLSSAGSGLFSGMEPDFSDPVIKCNNYLVCSSFTVGVDYTIDLPFNVPWFHDGPFTLNFMSKYTTPVNDTTTFIRNIDLIDDFLIETGVRDKIDAAFGKVKEFFETFGTAANDE